MQTTVKTLCALLVNIIMGVVPAALFGVPVIAGVIFMVAVAPESMPRYGPASSSSPCVNSSAVHGSTEYPTSHR